MTHKASINITTILSVLSVKRRVPLDCQSRGDINIIATLATQNLRRT